MIDNDFCGEFDNIDVEVFEDRYCLAQDEPRTLTPSQQAKAAGLKSLSQVRDMLGTNRSGHPIVSLQTLHNWHKHKPKLFAAVIAGCAARIAE